MELTLLKIHEMNRYVMAQKVLQDMKQARLARFVRFGAKPPAGWVQLEDRMFQRLQYSETAKGFVIRGHY